MNLNFYCPYYIELVFDFFSEFNIKTNKLYSKDKKQLVLQSILEMLDNTIIFVYERKENKFIKWEISNHEIIKKIDKMWLPNSEFPDFYNMVWFGYQDWYIKALKEKGYGKERIPWLNFVEKHIGDLQFWIDDNKPK